MKLLALDTSSDACSVALQLDDNISEQHVVQPKEHTNILVPMIKGLLRDAGAVIQDLEGIVLGNGPGSFIGVRIAASLSQGLAHGSGLKVVPISSLAAIAAEVMDVHSANRVVVAQDARMNEVYFGIYKNDGNGLPIAETEEVLQPIGKFAGLSAASISVAAGKAWHLYPELLALNRQAVSEAVDVQFPRARYLLSLAAGAWKRGEAIGPEDLVPAYIRMKVAEKPRVAGR